MLCGPTPTLVTRPPNLMELLCAGVPSVRAVAVERRAQSLFRTSCLADGCSWSVSVAAFLMNVTGFDPYSADDAPTGT